MATQPDSDAARAAGDRDDGGGELRTFLIADVRGYTRYTQAHGDEAAAELAARFAKGTRTAVAEHGGRVIELRGDEALAVFTSPRGAVRAAVAVQRRLRGGHDPADALPLGIGIGLDTGEAVAVEGGFRGKALNVAARLCSLARPGEVLLTETLSTLAGRVPEVRYVPRKPIRVKGIEQPVRFTEAVPEQPLPALPAAPTTSAQRPPRRRALVAGAVVSIVLVGVAGALFLGGETEAASLRANSLGRLDTSTGDVREQIAVGAGPTDVVAGDGDSLWVVSRQARSLWQVERSSGAVVDKIPVGAAPVAAAFGDGAVWVVDGVSRRLYRVDAATGSVVKEHEVGNGASAVAFAAGHAWVTNTLDGTLTVVDATSSDSRTVPVGLEPVALAADGRGVWVANRGSDNVVFLDATLLEPEAVAVGRQPSAVAVGGGAVWVANAADATVSKVDRARRSVVDTVPVGREPRSVAYAGDAAWVASEETGTVTRIAGDGDAEPTRVGGGPTALEAVNGELWVTALAARATHRGGTLRITGRFPVTDPYFMSPGANINPIVNDGLVAYRATGGPAGTELVPDLAQELPRPSADGRRYTFRLRRGIRYSSGDEVEASHVRESFERMFAVRADGSHFFVESIQGADRCIEQPAACDLSRAIVADDREATVTFRLARPDPLFLYKLALPPAWVLPPGTPRRPFSLTPLPATGPYMIDRVDRGRRMVLVRNPHFREWSRAAQPSGFPDRIVITTPDRDPQQLVATNRADVMEGVITPSAARSLAVRYPARVIAAPTNEVFTAVLNTNRPPFNDRRVRQALNYAVDRRKATAALGGPLFGRPTCQLIPPNVLGHRPFCPYTRRPSAGVWSAPDLARAKRLVAASGTRGSRVVVWTSRWPPLSGFGDVLVGALRSLGYRATVREIGGKDVYVYYNAFGPSRAAQIGPMRWGLDFPVPQDAFFPLISCDGLNRAKHCDPRLDAAFATASDLMVREPAAAPAAWAQIDRDVAERGLHVPLVNGTSVDFISDRVGNFQQHPVWGPLYSQMWVR